MGSVISKILKLNKTTNATVYYAGVNEKKSMLLEEHIKQTKHRCNDNKGNHKIYTNAYILHRYQIIEQIGEGTFSRVVKAVDHKLKKNVAIKVFKTFAGDNKMWKHEKTIMEFIKRWSRKNESSLAEVLDGFMHSGHGCIVQELLHCDLMTELRKEECKGFSISQVKKMCRSILIGLSTLDRLRIIHGDIKPHNIALLKNGSDEVKVIDFGRSCVDTNALCTHYSIGTKIYRAPELLLRLPYNRSIDMWAFGCSVFALLKGRHLFTGTSNTDQFMNIIEVKGLPPNDLVQRWLKQHSEVVEDYFNTEGKLKTSPWTMNILKNKAKKLEESRSRKLEVLLEEYKSPELIDFISNCMHWDPVVRLTPQQALKHSWLKN